MSMSTHIIGIKPADDKFRRMFAAYEACIAASVPVPEEVWDFFAHEDKPDPRGVRVANKDLIGGVSEWKDDMREGFEVDLRKVDPDIKILRFYNSY